MVILLYHNILTDTPSDLYSIKKEEFKRQLIYLKENKFHILTLGEIINILHSPNKTFPPRSITLTFDDGTFNHFETVYPLLKEFGFKGSFFIPLYKVGQKNYMSWEHIHHLLSEGMEIGSHGLTHRLFDLMSKEEIFQELHTSKKLLEDHLHTSITLFSLPRSALNKKTIISLAKEIGYKGVCMSDVGYITNSSSPLFLKRFCIKRRTSFAEFRKIVHKNTDIFLASKCKEIFIAGFKKIIGINNYEKMRRNFLKGEYINEPPFPE